MIRKRLPALRRQLKRVPTPENLLSLPSAPKLAKQSRRRLIRWGIVVGNLVLLVVIGVFVFVNHSANQTVRSSTSTGFSATASAQTNPLDQLSADQIAYQAALMTKLPELTIVRNRADSAAIIQSIVPNDTATLAKPQLVSTDQKSRLDIIKYKVQAGDSVDSVAQHFNISSDNLRFSNSVNGSSLTVGSTIYIPPGDGIVYSVKATDTLDSIVSRYQANRNTFITVNDAENGNLKVGELVWIPNAVQPVVVAARPSPNLFANAAFGAKSFGGSGEDNGYAFGWCTWWAAHRRAQIGRPIPPNWGDAYSWAAAAQQQGYTVSFRPQAGAVVWFPGMNHVGFVESVKDNGDVNMSEMNAAGWDVVSYRLIPADQTGNYKYIY